MGEPVQGGPGQPLAAQDLRPVLERQVRGDDQTGPFVGRADDVEQQFRADLRNAGKTTSANRWL